jgi:plasmid stability protein
MLHTCANVNHMSKMIQIRNVPEELHRTLKSRAALSGRSLSDYLLAELRRVAERPSRAELLARLQSRESVDLHSSIPDLIAEERNQR